MATFAPPDGDLDRGKILGAVNVVKTRIANSLTVSSNACSRPNYLRSCMGRVLRCISDIKSKIP